MGPIFTPEALDPSSSLPRKCLVLSLSGVVKAALRALVANPFKPGLVLAAPWVLALIKNRKRESHPLHQIVTLKDLLVVRGVLRGSPGKGRFQESPQLARSCSPPPWLYDVVVPFAQAVKNLLVVREAAVCRDTETVCPLAPPAD